MQTFIIRRLIAVPITILISSFIVFAVTRMMPGKLVDLILTATDYDLVDDEVRAAIAKRLGLDLPIPQQYLNWISDLVLRGDLGLSLNKEIPVMHGGTWHPGTPVRLCLGSDRRYIFRPQARKPGRPSSPWRRYFGSGNSRFLAGHVGGGLAVFMVGLDTTAGSCTAVRRSMVKPTKVLVASGDPGSGLFRRHHADDPNNDVRGVEPGLYPHGLGQGTARTCHHSAPRPKKCDDTGDQLNRFIDTHIGWRHGHHREYFQYSGSRQFTAGSYRRPRPSNDFGHFHDFCFDHHQRQLDGRSELWLPGSESPL